MRDVAVALEAARAGAARIRAARGERVAEFKGAVNPVTEIDRAAEEAILDVIRRHRPDDGLLAEEGGGSSGWDDGRVWIVDPLDGTVNFVHGIPQVAVSVAVWEDGVPLAGVVLDVDRDEVFSAERGTGARHDGRQLAVSGVEHLAGALVGTGFPYDRQERAGHYAKILARVLGAAQGVRRIGSAALDLCWVAAGRLDAHWEFRLAPWDVAAAILVVDEAGGRVSTASGEGWTPDADLIVASNGLIHDELLSTLGDTG
jgi:myo-inositol-1(or 4)-monophosphatase